MVGDSVTYLSALRDRTVYEIRDGVRKMKKLLINAKKELGLDVWFQTV